MRNLVYLLLGDTLQGTLNRMTGELAAGFAAHGLEPRFFRGEAPDTMEALGRDLQDNRVRAIVSMNIYLDALYRFGPFCEQHRVPLFFYCFDHPVIGYVRYSRLISNVSDVVISLTGEDELAAAGQIIGRPRNFTVLRQGVNPDLAPQPGERDIPGLLIGNNVGLNGTWGSPELVRASWRELSPAAARALESMVELHAANPLTPLHELARRAMPPSIASIPTLIELANRFDFYMRSKVRTDAIAALLDHDVVVCGEGWDHLRRPGQRATFLGSTPNAQCMELMRRTRCLFNIVPEYYSCSERVLEAALMAVPVVTTRSRFLEAEFGDTLRYATTAGELPDLMRQAGEEVAGGDDRRLARAAGIVRDRHTWTHRAAAILGTLDQRGFPHA